MQQTGTFSSALPRQVTEAVQIHNFKGEGFNRKQEFRQPATARAVYTRDIQEEWNTRTYLEYPSEFMISPFSCVVYGFLY